MTMRILLYATLGWPSAARYARGFAAAGCEVCALAPAKAPVAFSRYVAAAFRYRPLRPLSSLRKAIGTASPDLVVACDDRAVSHLLALYRAESCADRTGSAIASLLACSLGRPDKLAHMLSRSASLAEMKARDIRVPDTFPVRSEKELRSCLGRLGLPAVLKTDGSWGGEGIAIVHSYDQARTAWRKLARPPSRLRSLARAWRRKDLHFLLSAWKPKAAAVCIQRYIEGTQAASAFAAHKGRIRAAFHYDVLSAEGAIGPPSVIRRVDCPEMDRAAAAVAESFALTGLFGLDYIRDRSGAVHLIEINPRATQGGTLAFGTGRDLPSALVQCFGPAPAEPRPAVENDIVVFFPREWRRDPDSRFLREGHHDVPWDDPNVLEAMLKANVHHRNTGLRRTKRECRAATAANACRMSIIRISGAGPASLIRDRT